MWHAAASCHQISFASITVNATLKSMFVGIHYEVRLPLGLADHKPVTKAVTSNTIKYNMVRFAVLTHYRSPA